MQSLSFTEPHSSFVFHHNIEKCPIFFFNMNKENSIDPKKGLTNYRKTTELILNLPEDLKLPNNGWSKKDLLIHLWVWDREFIAVMKGALEGKPVVWDERFKDEDYLNRWNDEQIAAHRDKTLDEILRVFKEAREEVIALYETLLKHTLTEEQKTLFTLWQHDVHHLKQAGVEITF